MLTILGWRRPGKISNAYTKPQAKACGFFFTLVHSRVKIKADPGKHNRELMAALRRMIPQNEVSLIERTLLFVVCGQKFLLQFGKECVMIKTHPANPKVFTGFQKTVWFRWVSLKISTCKNGRKVPDLQRNVFKWRFFLAEKFRNEYETENFKKIWFFWKKVLTNERGRGMINKRSRERVKNASMTAQNQSTL